MGTLKIKRVYDEPLKSDGIRILVDRLWPRGVSKSRAKIDYWLTDIAPTSELRKWFNHEPEKFVEFSQKYREELDYAKDEVQKIKTLLKTHNVTLIYAAKSSTINHAKVLKNYIESRN